MAKPKYENIKVTLSNENGNIFNLMGVVTGEMKRAGVSNAEISELRKQVMASESYDAALAILQSWVTVL